MHTVYDDAAKFSRAKGECSDAFPANKMGVPIFSKQYRYWEVLTAAPASLAQPTDAFICSTDGTVTIGGADDDTTALAITVKAGVIYEFAVSKMTAAAAGTVTGLWHRKPSNP